MRTVGGAISGETITCIPKSGWTDAAVGDLVRFETAQNYEVDECANNENPDGQLVAVSREKDILTVELFTGGMIAVLPYSSAPSRGDKIEVGATANQIQTDNTNGVGKVLAVDRVSGYADVYFA